MWLSVFCCLSVFVHPVSLPRPFQWELVLRTGPKKHAPSEVKNLPLLTEERDAMTVWRKMHHCTVGVYVTIGENTGMIGGNGKDMSQPSRCQVQPLFPEEWVSTNSFHLLLIDSLSSSSRDPWDNDNVSGSEPGSFHAPQQLTARLRSKNKMNVQIPERCCQSAKPYTEMRLNF